MKPKYAILHFNLNKNLITAVIDRCDTIRLIGGGGGYQILNSEAVKPKYAILHFNLNKNLITAVIDRCDTIRLIWGGGGIPDFK